MDTQESIIKRLEELNKWQEEQKKLLQERQNMQRKMLGLEQRNMYKVLGLLHPEETDMPPMNVSGNVAEKETTKKVASTHPETSGEKPNDMDDKSCGLASTRSSGYATEDLNDAAVTHRQKRTFLKRGEGLKQRFKLDPETLRLNNLPRYKYANAHPNLKIFTNKKSYKNVPVAQKVQKEDSLPVTTELDAQEKRFQQLLITSKAVCNSTPEMKHSYCSSTSLQSDQKVRFVKLDAPEAEDASQTAIQQQLGSLVFNSSSSLEHQPAILWAKVLDSQQIKPMAVQDIRAQSLKDDITLVNRLEENEEDENLSIFQLLEQKANEGSIDMDASYIKRFMQRKVYKEANNQDEIPVHEQLKQLGLKPLAKDILNDDDYDNETSAMNSTVGENDELTQSNTVKNSECLDSSNSTPARVVRTQVRVRFSDENDTCEYVEEQNISETSTLTAEDSIKSEQLFQQFKDALFLALQVKASEERNDTNHSLVQSDNSTLTEPHPTTSADVSVSSATQPFQLNEDLAEKANLIKTRLAELEKEIANFKDNNLQLIKSKQEHELEKAHFAQEQLEAKERLNDEKVQIEIYLHDERMKIEDDKRKFEQQMRNTAANSKERKEIARLKQELQELQLQLRQKEQAHAASQARLRVQIKNMEKDQKQLHEDIERLGKENKKLQSEKVKLERESNNKMLQEINRNIAKLAPQLQMSVAEQHNDVMRPTKQISSTGPYSKTTNRKSTKSLHSQNVTIKRSNATKMKKISNNISSDAEEPLRYQKHNSSDDNEHKDTNNDDSEDDDEGILNELKKHNSCKSVTTMNTEYKETNVQNNGKENAISNEFKREIINEDGSKDILYPNGNLKKISADGMNIRMLYFNKDIKETNINEGTIKYYYAETNTWHTTYLDGLEILEFPNGQTEHRHTNGIVEIHFPNNSIKIINPADEQRQEEWRFNDGTNLIQMRNGDKILMLPNGQKEIHTKLNKRREYPDGTVKLVYPDGSQETRYSNGRLRLKDKDGNLVMDTENVKY